MQPSARQRGHARTLRRGAGGLLLAVVSAVIIVAGLRSAQDPAAALGAGPVAAPPAGLVPSVMPTASATVPVAFLPPQQYFAADYPPVASATQAVSPFLLPVGGFQPVAGGGAAALAPAFTPPVPLRSAPRFRMIPFVEAHWQGLEMIDLTPALARALGIDPNLKGIIADDVTPPADACGFLGADIVTAIDGVPTPTLDSFIAASARVHDQRKVTLTVIRKGQTFPLTLWALQQQLGNANGETAPMIPSGSVSPHAYQGACTGCHRIGTKGQLPVDQGDLLAKKAPTIQAGRMAPHRDRGNCVTCHQIIP
jgi:hypothetical protein